jgi:hypothetical protein
MRRTAITLGVLFALGTLIWLVVPGHSQPGPVPTERQADARPKGEGSDKAVPDPDPVAALTRCADFPGIQDPRATLWDALEILSELYHVPFEFNFRAFKYDGFADPDHCVIAEDKPLPAAKNIRLEVLLKQILERIPVPGATFLVRRECLQITTETFVKLEVWGTYPGPYLPLVHLRIDKLPLNDALSQLASQAGVNLVYNGGAHTAFARVSARLANVPADTAAEMLAIQVDLCVVYRDNVLIVTTPKRAASLRERTTR